MASNAHVLLLEKVGTSLCAFSLPHERMIGHIFDNSNPPIRLLFLDVSASSPVPLLFIIISILLALTFFLVILYAFVKRKVEQPCKILLLGPEHSGKTVFLSSMYYRFEVEDPNIGFFLDTEPKQREQLLNYRRQITDSSRIFPPSTPLKDLTEWKFTCYAKVAGDICAVARFTYHDYAGERINNLYLQPNQYGSEFQQLVDKANILVGIIDGQKLLYLMEGKNTREFYETSLRPILFILQRSKKPVHLIITKWDILDGKYSLSEIRNRLEENEAFKNFIATHRTLNTLRLIPVSSLGKKVVELQPNGEMKKLPNAQLEPYQLEMILASVLYDSLNDNLRRLRISKNSWFLSMLAVAPSPIAMVLFFFYWITKVVNLSLTGPYGVSFQIFLGGISFIDFLNARSSNRSGGVIRTKREAIEQIIVNFRKLLDKLESDLPESDLTDYNMRNNP